MKQEMDLLRKQKLLKPLLLMAVFSPKITAGESVPLIHDNGTFLVPVVINSRITLNFTVDSGASEVSIPSDVFSTLIRAGTISKNDMLGSRTYEMADGSVHKSNRFRIRSLRVGDTELNDVTASIAPQEGSLLLGQSFLARLKSWSMDNVHHALVFNEPPIPVQPRLNQYTGSESLKQPAILRATPNIVAVDSTRVQSRGDAHGLSDPQEASLVFKADPMLLRAVAMALTDGYDVHVEDWHDCVFQIRVTSPRAEILTFHLNNIDRRNFRITDVSASETNVTFSGGDVVVDEFGSDSAMPLRAGASSFVVHRNEWSLKFDGGESTRLRYAWDYIYANGCTGK